MTPSEIVTLVTQFISQVGFPIFVACYLLIVQTKALKKAEEAIDRLTVALTVLTASLSDEEKKP